MAEELLIEWAMAQEDHVQPRPKNAESWHTVPRPRSYERTSGRIERPRGAAGDPAARTPPRGASYCTPVAVLAGRSHIDDLQLALVRVKRGLPIDDPDLASELANDRGPILGPVAREAVARAGALVKAVTARFTLGRFMRRHEVGARP